MIPEKIQASQLLKPVCNVKVVVVFWKEHSGKRVLNINIEQAWEVSCDSLRLQLSLSFSPCAANKFSGFKKKQFILCSNQSRTFCVLLYSMYLLAQTGNVSSTKNLPCFLSYLWCWWLDYLAWSCTLILRSPTISESGVRSYQRSNRKMFRKYLKTASHTVQLWLKQKGFSTGYWGAGDGQGVLVCCDSWGRKDTTERLNWTELTDWLKGAGGGQKKQSWAEWPAPPFQQRALGSLGPGHMRKLPADRGDLPCSDWPQIYRIQLQCRPAGWGLCAPPLQHIIPF